VTVKTVATPEQTLRYAVFPAPPYMIGVEGEQPALSGIDIEIAQEIARRMKLPLEFVPCPWARCLELMQSGRVDMLSSVYKKPEREAFMTYFDEPYLDRLPIAFYFLKGRGYKVETYEDIYQFDSIGFLRGASYFERFDQDTQARKYDVDTQDQLFPLLLKGRVEAIAGYVPTENYRIAVEGYRDQVEKSAYEYGEPANVYLTLSKKSPLAARLSEFNQINQQLLKEGFVAQTINKYYTQYR
jgi:polar amino acid transport system substrate-binding protein